MLRMKTIVLLIAAGVFQTVSPEVTNCAAYENTNLCFNTTFVQISKTYGTLKTSNFPEMISIQTMEFLANNLTDIEPKFFSKFPNLLELIIRGNDQFPTITRELLKHCKKLRILRIYFNLRLHHIEENVLRNFPYLEELVIQSERMQHLRKHDLQVLTELRILKLDLTTLKKIDWNAFEPMDQLEVLSLMANNFLKINDEIFNWIPRLKQLNLIYAELTDLSFLKKLPKLENLRLAGNKITRISADTFENLSELRQLDLAHTGIKHIDTSSHFFSNIPKLQEIDITCHKLGKELFDVVRFSEHGITVIDKYADPEMRKLSCDA